MEHFEFIKNLLSIQCNMLSYARLLTSDIDDARDLTQDTTLKAIANWRKYIDNTNFKGWILTIMRNIFINQYRKMSRCPMVNDTTDSQFYINNGNEPTSQPADMVTSHGASLLIALIWRVFTYYLYIIAGLLVIPGWLKPKSKVTGKARL